MAKLYRVSWMLLAEGAFQCFLAIQLVACVWLPDCQRKLRFLHLALAIPAGKLHDVICPGVIVFVGRRSGSRRKLVNEELYSLYWSLITARALDRTCSTNEKREIHERF
jgi:hypothetical protein